jgi:hypothetical protein
MRSPRKSRVICRAISRTRFWMAECRIKTFSFSWRSVNTEAFASPRSEERLL